MAGRLGSTCVTGMDDVRIFGPEDVPRRVRDQAEVLWAWYDRAGSDPRRADEDLRRIEGGLAAPRGRQRAVVHVGTARGVCGDRAAAFIKTPIADEVRVGGEGA